MSDFSNSRLYTGLLAVSLLGLALLMSCRHTPTQNEISYAQIRYDLALGEAEEGNTRAAIRELQSAIELYPDFAEAHNAMGLILHLSMGRHSRAEEAYLKALRIEPEFSEAHNNIGALYIDMGRYDEAEKHLRAALEDVLYVTPHLAKGNLGWVLYLQGRVEEGLTHLRSAVVVQPKFCMGHRNLGRIYREQGRFDDARSSFERFVEHCPDVAEAQHEWGVISQEEGNYEVAREAFQACIELSAGGSRGEECKRHLEALEETAGLSRDEA